MTGGDGFIGGQLAESFARDGHDVVVRDTVDPCYDTRIEEQFVTWYREHRDRDEPPGRNS